MNKPGFISKYAVHLNFLSTQISQLEVVFSNFYLIWRNFFLFAPGKYLEDKTWPSKLYPLVNGQVREVSSITAGAEGCVLRIFQSQYVAGS